MRSKNSIKVTDKTWDVWRIHERKSVSLQVLEMRLHNAMNLIRTFNMRNTLMFQETGRLVSDFFVYFDVLWIF